MKKGLLIGLSLVLTIAIVVQFLARVPAEPPPPALSGRLPGAIDGWIVTDEPIANTEEMKRAVGELLNYDDAVFRSYRRGRVQFDVYVAYWQPGKMSQRLVAGHVPDVCWVATGWTMRAHEDNWSVPVSGRSMIPAAYRVFADANDRKREVAFWHLAGETPVRYQAGRLSPWYAPFQDFARNGFDQRKRQYFIRISSAEPLAVLARDPAFQRVLESLRPLGLNASVAAN